jgi:glycosyltransferase involved in cell wall biosynthesis
LELFPYVEALPAPVIYDAHNAEWRLQQRAYAAARDQRRLAPALYSLLQWQKLVRYEGQAIRRAAATVAVSETDRADLQQIAPATRLRVIPNGVDPSVYAPLVGMPEEEATILFAGKMDFRPNVEGALWLATRVLPLVWQQRPETRLVLFGMAPTPTVQALGRDPRIVVTGYLPGADAERAALARAAVVAVPLLSGGGTRLKVLHALAMARPVVSTPLGAAGYDLADERDLLLASSPAAFASAIVRQFTDRPLAHALGAAGRRRVVEQYAWERLLPELDLVLAEVDRG